MAVDLDIVKTLNHETITSNGMSMAIKVLAALDSGDGDGLGLDGGDDIGDGLVLGGNNELGGDDSAALDGGTLKHDAMVEHDGKEYMTNMNVSEVTMSAGVKLTPEHGSVKDGLRVDTVFVRMDAAAILARHCTSVDNHDDPAYEVKALTILCDTSKAVTELTVDHDRIGSVTELNAMAMDTADGSDTTKIGDHDASHSDNANAGIVMAISIGKCNHMGVMNAIPITKENASITSLVTSDRRHNSVLGMHHVRS